MNRTRFLTLMHNEVYARPRGARFECSLLERVKKYRRIQKSHYNSAQKGSDRYTLVLRLFIEFEIFKTMHGCN